MIFPKYYLEHHFSATNWETESFKKSVEVRGRKYRLHKQENQVRIERIYNGLFDMMGFVALRRVAMAKATIREEDNGTKVEFEIDIRGIYEVLIIGAVLLFGTTTVFLLFFHLKAGIFFGLFLTFLAILMVSLFRFGVESFSEDLRRDLPYFRF